MKYVVTFSNRRGSHEFYTTCWLDAQWLFNAYAPHSRNERATIHEIWRGRFMIRAALDNPNHYCAKKERGLLKKEFV